MPMLETHEETARVIMLEMIEKQEVRSMIVLRRRMFEEFPELAPPPHADFNLWLIHTWKKYLGLDDRVLPTHDLSSGKPLV